MTLSLEAAAAWALAITLGWITPRNAAEEALRPRIIQTAIDVVYDPWEPPLYAGPHGRE